MSNLLSKLKKAQGLRRHACYLLVIALSTFCLVEVTARLALRLMPEEAFGRYASLRQIAARDIDGRMKFSYHPNLGMVPSPFYTSEKNCHNALAFRGEEIPPEKGKEFRICCLGGSTTYDEFIEDYRLAYPAQLERLLREAGHAVRVINAGCPGYTTSQSLMTYLFRLKNLDIDMIIVNHGVNDWMDRLLWPPKSPQMGAFDINRAAFPVALTPRLSDHSTFLRMLKITFLNQRPAASFMGNGQNNPSHWAFYAFFGQLYGGTYPSGNFVEAPLTKRMEANPPTVFEANLRYLVQAAIADNVLPVLTSFAYRFPEPVQGAPGALEFDAAMAQMNQIGAALADEFGITYCDLFSGMVREPAYWEDFVHSSPLGAADKAGLLRDCLLRAELL